MPLQVRSSQNQSTQIGPEATNARGTAVDCDTRLASMSIELTPDVTTVQFGPTGQRWNSVVVVGKDKTAAEISGVAVYNELPYPLASVVGNVAPTQPGGTTTYDWVFTSAPAGGNTYRTYTVEQGDLFRAVRATQLTIGEFGVEINRDEFTVSGNAIAKLFTDDVQMYRNEQQNVVPSGTMTAGSFTLIAVHPTTGGTFTSGSIIFSATPAQLLTQLEAGTWSDGQINASGDWYTSGGTLPSGTITVEFRQNLRQLNFGTMTVGGGSLTGGSVTVTGVQNGATPSLLSLVPIIPNDVSVYMDSTAGNIGTTLQWGVMMTSWRLAGVYGELWTLDASQTSWTDTTDLKPEATFGLTAVADTQGMAHLARIRDNETRYFRIEANGPTIEGTFIHRLRIDMAAKVTAVDSLGDQDGAYAGAFVLTPVEDSSLGYAFRISLRNTLSAL